MNTRFRSAVLSFVATTLLLCLLFFSSVAFYNTETVLNSGRELAKLEQGEDSVRIIWMGQEYRLYTAAAEQAVETALEFTPSLPDDFRGLLQLSAAGKTGIDTLLDFLGIL